MTHKELVRRAERWLLRTQGCGFALTELASVAMEIPDAIGWKYGSSYLVECKASRADFLVDRKKPFRSRMRTGMGNSRYYMTLPGLIVIDDLPKGWGLLYCREKQVQVVRKATKLKYPGIAVTERHILCSALRRVHLRGDLQKIYQLEELRTVKREG